MTDKKTSFLDEVDIDWGQYDMDQMRQILLGHWSGLDISIYANPLFNKFQMQEIRLGLEDGLDVSQYADYKTHAEVMAHKRKELKVEAEKVKTYGEGAKLGEVASGARQASGDLAQDAGKDAPVPGQER